MTELQKKYEKAVNAYVKAYEEQTDTTFDFWIRGDVGGDAQFGDIHLSFQQIKYVVDNNIPFEYVYDCQYFNVKFQNCNIGLKTYCELRESEEVYSPIFCLHNFEKKLIYEHKI